MQQADSGHKAGSSRWRSKAEVQGRASEASEAPPGPHDEWVNWKPARADVGHRPMDSQKGTCSNPLPAFQDEGLQGQRDLQGEGRGRQQDEHAKRVEELHLIIRGLQIPLNSSKPMPGSRVAHMGRRPAKAREEKEQAKVTS